MEDLIEASGKAANVSHRLSRLFNLSGILLLLIGVFMLRRKEGSKVIAWIFIVAGIVMVGYLAYVILT